MWDSRSHATEQATIALRRNGQSDGVWRTIERVMMALWRKGHVRAAFACDWAWCTGVWHTIEQVAMALQREERHKRSLRKGSPTLSSQKH